MFEVAEKLSDLKATGRITDKDLPFDPKKTKNEFISTVMNFRPTFGVCFYIYTYTVGYCAVGLISFFNRIESTKLVMIM